MTVKTATARYVELSATKYRAVAAMLSAGTVEIHHRYRILRRDGADPIEEKVLIIGPHADRTPCSSRSRPA